MNPRYRGRLTIDPTIAPFDLIAHPAGEPASGFQPGLDEVSPELRQVLTASHRDMRG